MAEAVLAFFVAYSLVKAGRYMTYLVRMPARGLHYWHTYVRWRADPETGSLECSRVARCLRCGVRREKERLPGFPPRCEDAREFLLAEKVMES